MKLSKFFIDRPVFASVLSIIIFAAGLLSIPFLPVSEYPDVVPPSVVVSAQYPGANPHTIAESVAAPLEESINGVENLLFMKSVAGSDGSMILTATFALGTDADEAAMQVQNRVSQAQARLPEEVRRMGIVTQKQAPGLMMAVHLTAENGALDSTYIRNYAILRIRDELARVPGVGQAGLFGGGDYSMRVWLNPQKAKAAGVTAQDVLKAIREQNVQVSAGQLGATPMPSGADVLISINAQGRLTTVEEFSDIIVKVTSAGSQVRLIDIARIELASSHDSLRALLDGQPAISIPIFQAPGSNALAVSKGVRTKMGELAKNFPDGLKWAVIYDPTVFVSTSIRSVIITLLEAVLLVVIVVVLFLQTWRASLIPLLAVPVSIVGTFAVLFLLGFSVNTLTLFALVLSIGIVVDDAIVVVENVERHIEGGLTAVEAAHRAMHEVSGPIVAITLVLAAVFVPMAFLDGVTGQFYRQFAVTIAIATAISGINSLTLSPALAASLLKPRPIMVGHRAPEQGVFATHLFQPFNRMFSKSASGYEKFARSTMQRRGTFAAIYLVLLGLSGYMFGIVPQGFIPVQDKTYLVGTIRLPEGATLDRTEGLARKVTEIALAAEGVSHAAAFVGFNALQRTNTPNLGTVFILFDDFASRERSAQEISAEINRELSKLEDGFAMTFMPPPVLGLGTGTGYSLYIQDRIGAGYGQLKTAAADFAKRVGTEPGLSHPFSSYQSNVPQLEAVLDRRKAKALGVSVDEAYGALGVYFGSAYANDFNLFGRAYQVLVQADAGFRDEPSDLESLFVRNDKGQMVPVASIMDLVPSYGPDPVIRYNGYPAADIIGQSNPAVLSSGEALQAVAKLARSDLPAGFRLEWTDLSYLQVGQDTASYIIFPVALLLVFLVLAALYNSWSLPLSVILLVPVYFLPALVGVFLMEIDNNLFVQVGLAVLMALGCKNAILMVEFARDREMAGLAPRAAALEACRLRLRPIVMTSLAFIAGVVPLLLASGAGSEVKNIMGVTVFAGMIGVTTLGLLFTPVLYVGVRQASDWLSSSGNDSQAGDSLSNRAVEL